MSAAPPDGGTLLLCGPVNTINTTLFPDLDFDFGRDRQALFRAQPDNIFLVKMNYWFTP